MESFGGIKMKSHKSKMIAPIVVSIIMVLYYVVYFGFIISLINGIIFKLILGIVPLAFSLLTVKVCIDRIKEIKKGEEDDISKY